MSKYCVGVDFGSLSARALVADVADGRELAAATMDYPHAVMTEALPDGTRLPPDWALQHPQDYLDCLRFTVTEAVRRAGVSPEESAGAVSAGMSAGAAPGISAGARQMTLLRTL